MENNISRDHIALEAMKIILEKGTKVYRWPIISFFQAMAGKEARTNTIIACTSIIAKVAYRIADEMIAEREK